MDVNINEYINYESTYIENKIKYMDVNNSNLYHRGGGKNAQF